ncbi:MAG: protease inhibitor I42 family protein [Deltaproteobacteria bacterium]
MNGRSRATLLTLLLAGCGLRAGAAAVPAATQVAPGDRFDLRLEANPSTGYTWSLGKPLDASVLRLVASRFVSSAAAAPGGAPPLAGQGGNEIWTFEAVAPGRTKISMFYARPWEKGVAPAKIVAHTVLVR